MCPIFKVLTMETTDNDQTIALWFINYVENSANVLQEISKKKIQKIFQTSSRNPYMNNSSFFIYIFQGIPSKILSQIRYFRNLIQSFFRFCSDYFKHSFAKFLESVLYFTSSFPCIRNLSARLYTALSKFPNNYFNYNLRFLQSFFLLGSFRLILKLRRHYIEIFSVDCIWHSLL